MHQTYLDAIKVFEGFTRQAKWDYAQHSNGYGTKALYPGEVISPEEAEKRFAAEIAAARAIVERHAHKWDEGTKAALTSLTFNTGTRWISSGLGDAVRSGDIAGLRERFVKYSTAQGEVLPGLVKRRLAELAWIGDGPDGATLATNPSADSGVAAISPPAEGPGLAISFIGDGDGPHSRGKAVTATSHTGTRSRAEVISTIMMLLFELRMRGAMGSFSGNDDPNSSGRPQERA